MIDILDKKKCCGCSACVSICPKQCISMKIDEEGLHIQRLIKIYVLNVVCVKRLVLL